MLIKDENGLEAIAKNACLKCMQPVTFLAKMNLQDDYIEAPCGSCGYENFFHIRNMGTVRKF